MSVAEQAGGGPPARLLFGGVLGAGAALLCLAGIAELASATLRVGSVPKATVAVLLSLAAAAAFIAVVTAWLAWGELPLATALAAIAWGFGGALFLTNLLEPPLLWLTGRAGGAWRDWGVALVDAPVEEVSKVLGVALLALLFRQLRGRPAGLMIAGAIVGTAFQAAENQIDALIAILINPGQPTTAVAATWVQRSAELGVWLHPADTAIAAVAVAVCGGHLALSRARRLGTGAAMVALAVGLHLYWDAPFLRGAGVGYLIVGDLPRVASGLIAVTLVFRAVRRWPSRQVPAPAAEGRV